MKIHRTKLSALVSLICWVMFSVVSPSSAVINQPARIGGTLTVDGTQITQATDDGYVIVVKDASGAPFQDVQGKVSQDDDGLNTFNVYVIDIPIFDAVDQPKGAKPGSAAVVHVYLNSQELAVTNPSAGSLVVPEIGSTTTINLAAAAKQPPVADAGPDQTVEEGKLVTLDGSKSADPDGTIASYLWEQTAGASVTLSSTTAVKPTFTAPDVGVNGTALTFQLTVTDNQGQQSKDTCIVNVSWVNVPPTANAGKDQTVVEKTLVALDASGSTDSDDGIASYLWEQTQGTAVTLSDSKAQKPTFTAPDVDQTNVQLTFKVTVTDNHGLKSNDSCIVTVTPAVEEKPNLTPYKPSSWSDKIVVSKKTGTTTDDSPLLTTDTLYVDWAVINAGKAATDVRFYTALFIDGVQKHSWYSDPPLNPNYYTYVRDYSLGSLTAGTHTIEIVSDSTNVVSETSETDNRTSKTITVVQSTEDKPNLTPYKPADWSDKIVVSKKTGTTTDDTALLTTDTLYVDWAVANLGKAATKVKLYTTLFIDGVEKHSWYSDPPLDPNYYTYVRDYSLGSLAAGTHTIKIVADSTKVVTESSESDNQYTKTITVTAPRTLTITAPNGGESWRAGTTQTIRWKYTGKTYPTVKVQLLKQGRVVKTLTSSVSLGIGGIGSYSWRIPLTQTTGADYQIAVISNSFSTLKDVSNRYFTIRK